MEKDQSILKEGKRWNAEKLCIEDIPVRKFKKGDKVRIKHGVSSKTHYNIDPWFLDEMDDLIGKTMTVDRYIDCNNFVKCGRYFFSEDWLEPYKELEKDQNILKEADEIVNNRSRGYESAEDSFKNISQIASAIRRKNITPRDVSAVMIALKLSREQYTHKRDNNVDAAGYIQIDHLLAEAGYE